MAIAIMILAHPSAELVRIRANALRGSDAIYEDGGLPMGFGELTRPCDWITCAIAVARPATQD